MMELIVAFLSFAKAPKIIFEKWKRISGYGLDESFSGPKEVVGVLNMVMKSRLQKIRPISSQAEKICISCRRRSQLHGISLVFL
jgi:hypothetical protein